MNSERKIFIDVIILSYSKSDQLKELTKQSVSTCLKSENASFIEFNIIVIESNRLLKPYQFDNTLTIYPDVNFGFHKYLNIGIRSSSNEFICLCNNDLIFHKGWATSILNAMVSDPNLMSASPYCPTFHGTRNIVKCNNVIYGYTNGIHLAGWCIFVKRKLFEQIGLLDERFVFWCCDDDYRMTLKKYNIPHALVCNSVVEHLESSSINNIDNKQLRSFRTKLYTTAQQHFFDFKWNHKSRLILYLKYLKLFILDK